jgi:Skp family chaperone for outer membrane proteins
MFKIKFFLIFNLLFFFLTSNAFSSTKINIIDFESIFLKSIPGKSVVNQLDLFEKKMYEKFKLDEKNLKIIENQIVGSKNIISNEEFKNKIDKFKIKIDNYNSTKSNLIKNYKNNKNQEVLKFIDLISPLIKDYMEKNLINILIDKKNVFIASSIYDITDKIILIINKDIKPYKIRNISNE